MTPGPGSTAPAPRLTVVIRHDRADVTLDETVASLLAQTFQPLDIVVVTGGTARTDSASAVCKAYPATRVIEATGSGQAACDLGISASDGTYLCFLTPADTPAPQCFETVTGILDADASIAFVSCSATALDGYQNAGEVRPSDVTAMLPAGEPGPLMVRRSSVMAVGGFDRELGDRVCEDLDLRLRLIEQGCRGTAVDDTLFGRRELPPDHDRPRDIAALRRLIAKHTDSFATHLFDVLFHYEIAVTRTLLRNDELEREIDTWLAPQAESLRSELARLRRKLGAEPGRDPSSPTRREPHSASESAVAPAAVPQSGRAVVPASNIAVVILCRDMGRTVVAALESVLAQTRPAAEIAIVDEGSTDLYTAQVLASLDRSPAQVTRAASAGPAARNQGVFATSAPCVVLLDADALLRPTCLEQIGAALDRDPGIDFVSCAVQSLEDSTRTRRATPATPAGVLAEPFLRAPTMFRREVWQRVGGFGESCMAASDLDFWLSALEHGCLGIVLDEPLILARFRDDAARGAAARAGTRSGLVAKVWQKHRETVEALGPGLLVAREERLRELMAAVREYERRKRDLQHQLSQLRAEIATMRCDLRERGQDPLDWGDFRRLAPFSPVWGCERGKPLDRAFIERFLDRHRHDIRGHVLEVKDSGYTDLYASEVTKSDVIDINPANPRATIIADLTCADGIASEQFDCFIMTQTLHIIFDVSAALFHASRILKPGGVLLCTVPAVSRVNFEDGGLDSGDYWRFTEASIRRLFAEEFPPNAFDVTTAGNLLACVAFLYGLSPDELDESELNYVDPWFPLLFCIRAVKPAAEKTAPHASLHEKASPRRSRSDNGGVGLVVLYHRVGSFPPDTHGLCVHQADFRKQLEYLSARCRPMPLEELVRSALDGHVPPRAVAVTFDDGYIDALEIASPILTELGIPATFFLGSDHLEQPREFWWDTLESVLLSAEIPSALELMLGTHFARFQTGSAEERLAAHRAIHEFLIRASLADRLATIERLIDWSGRSPEPRPSHRPMTAPEVRRLATRPGHAIGAHSVHHLYLPSQPIETQRQEIRGSKEELERAVGRPVLSFAYPYGAAGKDAVDIVRGAGIELAVTVDEGVVAPGVDPFLIPRLEVSPDMMAQWPTRITKLLERR